MTRAQIAVGRDAGVAHRSGSAATAGLAPLRSPHVVIVGGGFGGLSAARALARAAVQVTVIDQRNYHLFQPLLYQVASAGLSPNEIAYPIRGILRRQRNTRVLLGEAASIDLAARQVVLRDGAECYDYLIVATGARHSYFTHPEWEAQAPGLKTLEDALEIRRRMLLAFEQAERETDPERRRALLTFVIVGGGPTGVELAGAISEMACLVMARDFRTINPRSARTLLVEAGPRILPAFPPELSAKASAALTCLCVDVRTSSPVQAVGPGVVTIGGERIAAATVLWAAGIAPSPLVRTLGVPLDRLGRVLVDADLSVPAHPEVFVVGDAAAVPARSGKSLPGLAPVAIQEGRHAAASILRRLRGQPTRGFRYVDRGMLATIGRANAVMSVAGLRISGFAAWSLWLSVHIFWLIGFRNRVLVCLEWAWAYLTYQRSARLILGSGR